MPKTSGFSGINNVDRPALSGPGDFQVMDNVIISDAGLVQRRGGFTSVYAGAAHSLYNDSNTLLYVNDDDLTRYDPVAPAGLMAGLTPGANMGYLTLNGVTYFSNGIQKGVLAAGSVRTWGLTAPPSAFVHGIAGGLTPGTYQVALTYVRSNGIESGTSEPMMVEATGGGIRLTSISPSADPGVVGIAIYVTGVGGEVFDGSGLQRYTIISNAATARLDITNVGSLGTGAKCQTFASYPPPAGTITAFYRGRLYIASGSTLWWTMRWMYENVQLDNSSVTFQSPITNVLPVENGIWVTTTTEYAFLSFKDPAVNGGMEVKSRVACKCFAGGVLSNGDKAFIRGVAGGTRAVWVSEEGIIVGDANGGLAGVTAKRWTAPTATAGVFGIIVPAAGQDQYVFALTDSGTKVYSVNMKTWAVCTWDRSFTSAAVVAGTAYFGNSSGIFSMGAATDGGFHIDAEMEKREVDFGSPLKKRVTEAYLRGVIDGSMLVEVSSEDHSGTSTTMPTSRTEMRGHKVHVARGVSGVNFSFNIKNVDGAMFALHEFEYTVSAQDRHGR